MAETTSSVCPYCRVGWPILPHDRFCGYCGRKVFDYAVKWERNKLLYIDSTAPELSFSVENTGLRPIRFEPITVHPEEAIQVKNASHPFRVNPGQSRSVRVQCDPAALAAQRGQVTVRAEGDPLPQGKSLTVATLPVPKFELLPQPDESSAAVVAYRKNETTARIDLRVHVLESAFYISDIQCDDSWIQEISFAKNVCFQRGKKAESIQVEVNCRDLKPGQVSTAKLKFKLQGRQKWVTQSVQIKPQIKPELSISLEGKYNVVQGKQEKHSLTLTNQGGGELVISNVTIDEASGLVKLLTPLPIRIRGDDSQNLLLLFDGTNMEPGTRNLSFTIHSNCCRTPSWTDTLTVTVEEITKHPYYIAVDFGTTNSCCAYIDKRDGYKVKLVSLEPLYDETGTLINPYEIIPSIIVYHKKKVDGKDYHVGYRAEEFRTSADGRYLISSVKRWLGYRWKRAFPGGDQLQPRDVVRDILKYLIVQTENHLNQKIDRCVVSYPTMFSRRQKEDLKWALKDCGIENIILIDEASAGALGYIYQRKRKRRKENDSYTLLVYDFGGGTIDIVLSQVTVSDGQIKVEPLSWGGNTKFGGDNVTQAIVDFILERCYDQIREKIPGTSFYIPYLKMTQTFQSTRNSQIDEAIEDNSLSLYREAEEMKRHLTDYDTTERTFNELGVVIGNEVKTIREVADNSIQVKLSRDELEKRVQPRLSATLVKIDSMLDETGLPDVVILTGQSSQMPIVKRIIQEHFQKGREKSPDIQLAEKPKACVAMGAGQLGLARSLPVFGGGDIDIIDFSNRTHSRFGIAGFEDGQAKFVEIIDKGKVIPDESIGEIDYQIGSEAVIDVREHFGARDDLDADNASQIGQYIFQFPEDEVSLAALRQARLEMAVREDDSVELCAIVAGKRYPAKVQRDEPPFINEIKLGD